MMHIACCFLVQRSSIEQSDFHCDHLHHNLNVVTATGWFMFAIIYPYVYAFGEVFDFFFCVCVS